MTFLEIVSTLASWHGAQQILFECLYFTLLLTKRLLRLLENALQRRPTGKLTSP